MTIPQVMILWVSRNSDQTTSFFLRCPIGRPRTTGITLPIPQRSPLPCRTQPPSPLHQGYSGQLTRQLFPPSLGLGSSSSGGPISQCALTFWHGDSKQNAANRMAISTVTPTVTLCMHFSHCSEPCSTPLCTSRGGALQGLDWCLELLFTHPPCKSCQMIKKNAMR